LISTLMLCAGVGFCRDPAPAVGFAFPDAIRVWREKAVVTVPLLVDAPGDAVVVRLELVNLSGDLAEAHTFGGTGRGEVVISLVPRRPGWYRLRAVVLQNEQEIAAAATPIAILPDPDTDRTDTAALRNPFGVCVHFGRPAYDRPETRRLLVLSGIRWVRDNLYWGEVEKEAAGAYTLPERETWNMRALREEGIRTLAILGFGNPWYDHAAPEAVLPFERCCEWIARELAGTVDHFEIWNEPNAFGRLTEELYPPILKAGYRGVKRGNAEAFVVGIGGASPGGWSAHYIVGGIYPQDAVGFMDSFSIHPYCSPWAPETGYNALGAPAPLACLAMGDHLTAGLPQRIQEFKGLAEPPGMWITELGWPVAEAVPLDLEHEPEQSEVLPPGQAQFAARAFLFAAAHPELFERCFFYEFVTTPGAEPRFGLLHEDLSPRPAFVAAAVAANTVADRPFLRRIGHPDDRVHLYVFGPEDEPLLVGWITETSPAQKIREPDAGLGKAGSAEGVSLGVRVPVAGGAARLSDWQGRRHAAIVVDGHLHLNLTTWPQYVRGLVPGVADHSGGHHGGQQAGAQ
jgi:hypothetical protein